MNTVVLLRLSRSTIHARPCIDSQEASPAMFDSHLHHRDDLNQFHQNMNSQLSALHTRPGHDNDDDDDEMALGDEASGLIGNMSDDDGNNSHSMNVSPTMEDDNDDAIPELVDQKTLRTPPLTPTTKPTKITGSADNRSGYQFMDTDPRPNFSTIENDDSYNRPNIPTVSNNYSSVGILCFRFMFILEDCSVDTFEFI